MTFESYKTTFCDLGAATARIDRVEIPLFQRDYAQGRESDSVQRIREDFLDALVAAVTGDEFAAIGLDFVYGGVDEGTLKPLDGQQRLTVLFLLHWYLASRAGVLSCDLAWANFSYATRQSARMFCESLVRHPLPESEAPSAWIKDQPWYLFVWRHDPTIQSMLVVLDAIDERFRSVDAGAAWARLTDRENPAIWFLLLPLEGLGSKPGEEMRPEDLYIKMNSRGKPLTEFENFKAHFEETIQWSSRSTEFAVKVDTVWSDMLWQLRGDDDLIDDEFLRYLEFVTEVREWRDGRTDGSRRRLDRRTREVFGEECESREANLDFLFKALDVWACASSADLFNGWFSRDPQFATGERAVPLFFRGTGGADQSVDLFEACCRSYGETRGKTRVFSLGQSLTLYAVLLHLIEGTDDFPRRIRVLRNLIEASTDELRPQRMPAILVDVHAVIRDGAVERVATLNQAQVEDETLKAVFLSANPQLEEAVFALEDHWLLRGSLGAFELDAHTLVGQAQMFDIVMSDRESWTQLLAALLATGEYQRQRTNSRPFLFGTSSARHDAAWRELLTGPRRDALSQTRRVLGAFLDRLASVGTSVGEAMDSCSAEYLSRCEADQQFDWRYYMVKYPAMRENGSSTYYSEQTDDMESLEMGYSLCMLRAGLNALNSIYRDPYLLAIFYELGSPDGIEDPWFSGYETQARRMELKSGATIRCVVDGFELTAPEVAPFDAVFDSLRAALGCDDAGRITVPQTTVGGRLVDEVDRVQVGRDIVGRLVEAGL